MACGSCGGAKKANTEYEVTFKDGSVRRVASMADARVLRAQDTTTDPNGVRRATSIKVVPKLQK